MSKKSTLNLTGGSISSSIPIIVTNEGVKGVSKVSALRIRNEILNTFYDKNKYAKLRKLFQLDRDGLTIKKIDNSEFEDAIKGLSLDERSLANAYFLIINSQKLHLVDMTKRDEKISSIAISSLLLPIGSKGIEVDSSFGGGVNAVYPNGTISVIVIDSEIDIGDFTHKIKGIAYERYSTPAELLAHELLGHGYGRVIVSPTYKHEDAVQMSNLYWRVRGYNNFYRNGRTHGSSIILDENIANKIPSFFEKP